MDFYKTEQESTNYPPQSLSNDLLFAQTNYVSYKKFFQKEFSRNSDEEEQKLMDYCKKGMEGAFRNIWKDPNSSNFKKLSSRGGNLLLTILDRELFHEDNSIRFLFPSFSNMKEFKETAIYQFKFSRKVELIKKIYYRERELCACKAPKSRTTSDSTETASSETPESEQTSAETATESLDGLCPMGNALKTLKQWIESELSVSSPDINSSALPKKETDHND